MDHSNVFLSKPECTWASHLQLLGMLAHVPPSVALPSAQKITLVVLFVTSSNCGRKSDSSWFFFSGGLSCVPLFFEPLFSEGFQISSRARIWYPFARCPYIFFGAPPELLRISAPATILVQSVARISCHITSRRERSKQPARCQVVAVTLRAFTG